MMRICVLLGGVAVLAGCSLNPTDYETTPVVLQTPAGPVTCQLYTHEQVTWDRSTNRPANMAVATADELCRQEGYRVMRGGSTAVAVVADPAAAL